MVRKNKKLWAHYEQVKKILWIYLTLFLSVPVLAVCFSLLSHSREIDAGVEYAVKTAILVGLKWAAIILPILAVLFFIWFLFNSDTVELTETSIKYWCKHFELFREWSQFHKRQRF